MSDETPSISRKFGWKKTIVYSLIPLVVLLAILEVGARIHEIWVPAWQVDYGWGFDPESRVFVRSQAVSDVMCTNPSKEVSFQKQQFPASKAANTFRVFMLGGSSVNYLYYSLRDLGVQLTIEFAVHPMFEFIDCGGLAYGTHRLTPLLSEVLEYQPDLILFYEGHNEFEELEQLQFVNVKTLPLQKILYRSAFCRLIRDRIGAFQVSRLQRDKNRQLLSMAKADYMSGAGYVYTPAEIDERMRSYRNNLSIMMSLCRTRNVPFIIGTVPSNLWKPDIRDAQIKARIQELYDKGSYEEGVALARETLKNSVRHQASDTENGIIRDLAKENGVPLADVETAVVAAEPHRVPGETLFNDRCHLNETGNQILIKVFKEQIVKLVNQRESQSSEAVSGTGGRP